MKLKKLLCTMLAAGMLVSLTACSGGSDTGESDGENDSSGVPTVSIYMPSTGDMSDAAAVEAAINEISAEKYGVKLSLNFIPIGNWNQQSNLLMTGDEADIMAIFNTPLSTFVNNRQLTDLTEYVDGASEEFHQVWTDEDLVGTSIGGSIYAIPNLRNFGNYFGLDIDEDIAAEFEIQDYQKWTMDDVSDFLYEVHEKYPDRYALAPQQASNMVQGWTWDGLGDQKNLGVLEDCGAEPVVKNLFDTDDFQDFCAYTRQWYEDGLMMPDALSNTEEIHALINADKAVSGFSNFANNANAGSIHTVVVDAWTMSNSAQSLCYGINANSKNPDAAWDALEMIYIDSEISTLLTDGIEGQHYVKNDDGTISYPEGKSATDVGYSLAEVSWIPPYAGNTLPFNVNGPTYFTDLIEFNTNSAKSCAYGFVFDTSSVVDQYSACSNIMDKYLNALMCGAVDTQSTIEQANAELEAAGINDIIQEKQKQLDEYLAANN